MKTRQLVERSEMPVSAEELLRWHGRPGALRRLIPPWEPVEVLERAVSEEAAGPVPGSRSVLRVGAGPLRFRWVSEHRSLGEDDGPGFRDVQLEGPFARWEHAHRVEPAGPDRSILEDRVEYALPGGVLGRLAAGGLARRRLRRIFAYRHRVLAGDLRSHARAGGRRFTVAVTGSSGLVGSALTAFLRSGGHRVVRLVRSEPEPAAEAARWDPTTGYVDTDALEGIDGVVHLAGASIEGYWTEAKKEAIRRSRVQGTHGLASSLAGMDRPPSVLVSVSGVDYYGDRGDETLTAESEPGDTFLAGVCREWEAATDPAREAGVRVVRPRLGMVLTPAGGALARMLPAFQLGLGGALGGGRQWISWIALDDVLDVILRALVDGELEGSLNAVAPEPVRNREFTGTLAAVLSRRAFLRVPEVALRTVGGQMAQELLLGSVRARPARLLEAGHAFRHPTLEEALRHVLGRTEG